MYNNPILKSPFIEEDLNTQMLCLECSSRLNRQVKTCCGIRHLAEQLKRPLFPQFKSMEALLRKTMINHTTCEIHMEVFDFQIGQGNDIEILCKYCLVEQIKMIFPENDKPKEFQTEEQLNQLRKKLSNIKILDNQYFIQNKTAINSEFQEFQKRLEQLTSDQNQEILYRQTIESMVIQTDENEKLEWPHGDRQIILNEVNDTIQGIEERMKTLAVQGENFHQFLHDRQIEESHYWKLILEDIHNVYDLKYGLKVKELDAQCKQIQYL